MKAAFFRAHGGLEVVEYGDMPVPEPGEGQVQVRLRAAALNRLDLWVRNGWPGLKLELPHVSGADGAGEVSALGRGVSGFSQSDRVVINANLGCGACEFCLSGQDNLCRTWNLLGETVRGTFAEYVVLPAANLLLLPAGFDFAPAAAAGLVFHTAWHSLISRGRLQPGETVLVVGASGGVNTACIQVAKLAGATVFVVGSNEEKLRLAESLGAEVLIDRSKSDNWSKAAYEANAKRGMDVVVDNVGAGTMMLSLRALRKGGRLLTVGNTGGAIFEMDNRLLFGKHLSIIGSSMGTKGDFATVMGLVFRGRLRAVQDRQFPLSEVRSALERLESGLQLGKITLEM